ncbi:DNA-protecting protein DprA [Chryseobacterium lactis]|uniref:DNA-protecting protein DprA n=1 Tax=Chryseobacterium lactis TaxID=1241981 RepID=A0A3G6RY52_CHRLC|nr:DNA-processing protein DprA [Chryseobacterium lactis]AZA81512.1 DNA-protecting protein DprA [Chryseobacterium lactis]AZB06510.1 DNA-protecting protein DprA [Chryseobacterium lactis]PNW15361.1 DNA-protecting protein DprA [Chryseobacterium lactis]
MISEEYFYAIALRECSQIGDINFHKLVRTFGSAHEAWKRAKKEYKKIDGLGQKTVSDIGNETHLKFAEKEIQFCEKNNILIRLRHLNEIPTLLNECIDAPAILYQKGNIEDSLKKVSMVGTRNMTSYGKQFIEDFFEATQTSKYASVSGLALGIDKEVHEQSIRNHKPTIAVLAHGFQFLYPAKNRKLSEKILQEGGALLTEFNSSRKPDRENFIQRNRIVAGISPSTIVVETGFGGGSVSTASFANEYNRDVFALPGKITDPYSQGCNQLIFQNKAASISTIKDLISMLGFNNPGEKIEELFPYSESTIQLTDNQKTIHQFIKENPQITLDDLVQETALPSHKILPIILELELLGKVKSFSGRQFVVI